MTDIYYFKKPEHIETQRHELTWFEENKFEISVYRHTLAHPEGERLSNHFTPPEDTPLTYGGRIVKEQGMIEISFHEWSTLNTTLLWLFHVAALVTPKSKIKTK